MSSPDPSPPALLQSTVVAGPKIDGNSVGMGSDSLPALIVYDGKRGQVIDSRFKGDGEGTFYEVEDLKRILCSKYGLVIEKFAKSGTTVETKKQKDKCMEHAEHYEEKCQERRLRSNSYDSLDAELDQLCADFRGPI
uniref:Uncharacterized protein n=1 Tax=Corethron hystrix TaxID=216773 RepID=A0A7S1BVW5_9STRA|mmetsp:Transcript_43135/g.101143  ORF Transcript_43135/g.101143 Transcript_43135/m.101143 type:complete len:137 (+) Transcript_43135:79-489(+)